LLRFEAKQISATTFTATMQPLTEKKLLIVQRKTRLEELVMRYNTVSQAQFYIEHLGADFSDYLREHDAYKSAIREAVTTLEPFGRVQTIDWAFLPNFIFEPDAVVIAIGRDGLVANTLKYLSGQPVVGVNPDVKRWDGILLPFEVKDLAKIVPEIFKEKRSIKEVTMAKVQLTDGQELYAVNDFYIGQKTHVSSRYEIRVGDAREQHSSSGIVVSTGLGSTGWFKSILTGAAGIVNGLSNTDVEPPKPVMTWDSNHLYFSVREPFTSKASGAKLVFGKISDAAPLKILSQMSENGVICSDGVESDFLAFNSGVEATVALAEKRGRLVV